MFRITISQELFPNKNDGNVSDNNIIGNGFPAAKTWRRNMNQIFGMIGRENYGSFSVNTYYRRNVPSSIRATTSRTTSSLEQSATTMVRISPTTQL